MSLGFLQPGHGQPLQVEPPEPVISVPMGGSCQLTCSLSCVDGMVALVKWHGLDITQGAVQSSPGISVLSVHEATLSATGTRRCVGSCGARNFQHSVQILVYAFPDQLAVSPTVLVPGQSQEVSCTAHNVTPVGPDTLFFTLLLGDQELEGVQALSREEEEEDLQEAEGPLFQVTERWLVPALAISTLPALLCRATMRLPGLEQSHCRAFPAPGPEVVQPPTAPWVGSLVLGLLLLAMLTYCLWKHWRTQAEEHTHLPAPLRLLPLPE
ncbi:mucosal addressin cell adhesion molecule 1 isoform X2 [Dipodomys spectabilis]|uniref:mucosal addressin cell adhesion molecule 1 isoform X2 n=1 Tax=Dipodomys spectabilis TaxID=105255 RepID=UPI001C53E922|nr:mucosal addressin cell adhesion molecule 1 isoform X2 [Dipodomys spectabilis]